MMSSRTKGLVSIFAISLVARHVAAFKAPAAGVFLPSLRSGVESRHAPLRVASSGSTGRAGKSFQAVRMMTAAAPSTGEKATIVGPAWDNTPEYPSMGSAEFKADMDRVEALSKECGAMAAGLNLEDLESIDVQVLIEVSKKMDEAVVLLSNCATYVSCEQSTDGGNEEARSIMANIRSISSTLTQQVQPVSLALKLISDDKVNQFLAAMPSEKFAVMHSRKQKDFTLSLAEENLVTALSVDGLNAWNQMHSAISSTMQCDVNGVKMGIAKAASLLADPDSKTRRSAWDGIHAGWTLQEEAAAASLNSITGWRAEVNRRRTAKAGRPVHYLDSALHSNRMTKATLDAMMTAVAEAKPLARRALKLQAKALGVEGEMHPADLMAPPPFGGGSALEVDFDAGIKMVADAVEGVHPDVSKFVNVMQAEKWVDGSAGDRRAPGAYCTKFAKSRTPRVYMGSYSGSFQSVSTLAHELGHAYHNWVMRDMEMAETRYPMNLAETASIFFETVVSDSLIDLSKDDEERLQYRWYDAESAVAFLMNLPARYEFDCAIHQAREEGKNLTPKYCKEQMSKAWENWYGDSLSTYDDMFWASKLHFHITGISFYNFPYTFGYMFALGVYAQQEAKGEDFYDSYKALLRDTGRMTAEEVVQKHLGVSIEDPEFWRGSVRIIESKIDDFEMLVNKVMADKK